LKIIDGLAFSGTALQSIDLSPSLEFIGDFCFFSHHSLKSFTPESESQLKTIGSGAFLGIHLEELSVPDDGDIDPEAFSWDLIWPLFLLIPASRDFAVLDRVILSNRSLVFHCISQVEFFRIVPELEVIGESAFARLESLRGLHFVHCSQLRRIEASAFCCTSLRSLVLPRTVEILCDSCFNECQFLASIEFELPPVLSRIESSAFSFCGIVSISLPGSVQFIGSKCFSNCESLDTVLFDSDSSLSQVGSSIFTSAPILAIDLSVFLSANPQPCVDGVFAFSKLATVTIPAHIRILHARCFFQCKLLKHLEFESDSQLEEIGNECFRGCGMKKIFFPDSLVRIGAEAFAECLVLQDLHFENSSHLTRVEAKAFEKTAVTFTRIPLSIRFLGSYAFGTGDFGWTGDGLTADHHAMFNFYQSNRGLGSRFGGLAAQSGE
jgi:hypothetical protein